MHAITSNGGNLGSPGTSCGLTQPDDQVDVPDLLLSPLAYFGGLTRTRLPLLGSPAIGGGSTTDCKLEDQRGELRSDGNCDAGAVERQPGDGDPIFFDGFEAGDTSGWTTASP